MPRLNPFALGRVKLTKLWEAQLDGHIVSVAWSTPLNLIAAASADGPIALLDAKTGIVRHHLLGHGFGTSCVAWSGDGMRLASAGQDGKARLWDAATGQAIQDFDAGAKWVERVTWQGDLLATAAGKKLRLWNAASELLREYPDHPSTIADIQWQPGEPILASACYGKLLFWSPEQPTPIRTFDWQGSMLVLAWSPDRKHIAAGAQDSSVHFWRLSDGDDLQMTGYPTKVRELSWDATSRFLATGGGPVPCIWDFSGAGPAGSTPLQFDAHKDNVTCLAFQPTGSYLVSGGEDGLVALWNPGKQQGLMSQARHADAVSQLVWGDDHHLAIATGGGQVAVYTV